MMMTLFALLLAQADDSSFVAQKLDSAIRAIAGYKAADEAKPMGDEAFLKRLTRDLIDDVPSDAELKAFVADVNPAKRATAVDRLLSDPRFDAFWARRFSREFFGDPEKLAWTLLPDKPAGLEKPAVARFEQWLATRFQKDAPWTEIVSAMLSARGTLDGDPAIAYLLSFYRGDGAPAEFAQGVSRHFLGIRLYCAKCHDHPYDNWRVEDFYGLSAFVARQKADLLNGSPALRYVAEGDAALPKFQGRKESEVKMAGGGSAAPVFLFGGMAGKDDDRMNTLAAMMTHRSNTQLPKALANRVWGWLFGVGIVNPVDDFTMKNKPVSPQVMDVLARDTVDHRYSLKRLIRVLCATRAYEMETPEEAPEATSYRHLVRARLERGRYYPLLSKPASTPLTFDVPAGWTRMKAMSGAKELYVVRSKGKAPGSAEFTLYEGKRDRGNLDIVVEQFVKPKKTSESFEGKGKVTLSELSGPNTCIPGRDGPTEFVVLAALLEFPAKVFTIRFEGPAAVVNDWRDEFLALLKAAVPR